MSGINLIIIFFKVNQYMQEPKFKQLIKKSHLLKSLNSQERSRLERMQFHKQQQQSNIKHKLFASTFLSSITHILLYPIDTIKTRIIAQHLKEDVAHFTKNKVSQLTVYKGFGFGYLSLIVGNICFTGLAQDNFYKAILAEGFLTGLIDWNKIAVQMGNKHLDFTIFKKTVIFVPLLAISRVFVSRLSFFGFVDYFMDRYKLVAPQIQKKQLIKYSYFGAILATFVSHPIDVLFIKMASQKQLKYTGIVQMTKTVIFQETYAKLFSGFFCRFGYNMLSSFIMVSCYVDLLKQASEAF